MQKIHKFSNPQMAGYIPFEMQGEIMKRLPTKSLMRFRSVSKPWKSLIDSPKFIADYSFNQRHLLLSYIVPPNHNQQKHVSFVDDDTFPLEKVSLLDPIPEPVTPVIVGSSQGLSCLYNISIISLESGTLRRILHTVHLWNPSIRKSVDIDVSHLIVRGSWMIIGFGVCPHTSDPKLVMIKFNYSLSDEAITIYTPWQVEVYTLSSRAWRSIPTINQPRKSIVLWSNHVVINEFIYWLGIDDVDTHKYNAIVSFDLTSEGFMEVSLPDKLARAYSRNVVISKLKDSLVMVEVVKEAGKMVYGVWMMEHGVSNSFTKLFSINSPDASIQRLLGFRKNNEPIFAMRIDKDVDDVFVNELHSEHINYIGISENGDDYRVRSYMETLLLLDQ